MATRRLTVTTNPMSGTTFLKENPMRKSLVILATAGTFLVLPATAAQASVSGPVTSASVATATTNTTNDKGDKTGLWGLLGLIGLAGLAKRKVRDDAVDVRTDRR